MIILGDIHSNFDRLVEVCNANRSQIVLQLGDFGVGSIPTKFLNDNMPSNARFFAGNHDNRPECKNVRGYLGDYGEFEDIFFVSGANSHDAYRQYLGLSWRADEELTMIQANHCLVQWQQSNKQIIVAHDIPQSFAEYFFLIYDKSLTRNLLQEMINVRKPKLIVAGHHHRPIRSQLHDIQYVGLKIDEVYELPVVGGGGTPQRVS